MEMSHGILYFDLLYFKLRNETHPNMSMGLWQYWRIEWNIMASWNTGKSESDELSNQTFHAAHWLFH